MNGIERIRLYLDERFLSHRVYDEAVAACFAPQSQWLAVLGGDAVEIDQAVIYIGTAVAWY
jgi:hypothetical protein